MAWATVDLAVEQNATYSQQWLFFNTPAADFGNPGDWTGYNFTGVAMTMKVYATQDVTSTMIATWGTGSGEIVLGAGTVVPGPAVPGFSNGFTLTISATQTAALAPGVYYYDLLFSLTSIVTYIFVGSFEVVATVSR